MKHTAIGAERVPWIWKTIGEVGKVVTGNTPATTAPENYGNAIPFVKPTELVDGPIFSAPQALSEVGAKIGRTVPVGAVLVSCIGKLGKTAIARVPIALNQQLNAIVFDENVLPEFGFYFVQTLRPWLYAQASATTLPIVNKGKFQSAPFPLIPLDEQRDIVNEIETQFSRLDDAVTSLKRVKANLKRYKATVLKAAVEGRLVPTEAELARRDKQPYETSQLLLQRLLNDRRKHLSGRSRYKDPVAFEDETLEDLPDGWAWASVDQLAAPEPNSITDGPFGSNLKSDHYQGQGPRVIRLQNIKDGEFFDAYAHISTEHFETLRKHEIFGGDLAIASLGENPPRSCIIPLSVGSAIVKADCIRFKPHCSLSADYLNFALNSQPTRKRVKDVLHGIGRPRLSLGEIRAIALPIPPLNEQRRIVAEVERHLSVIRAAEKQVDISLKRAEALRQATLQTAFASD